MDYESFVDSLSRNEPPKAISPYLLALWYDAKHQWDRSHDIAQDITDAKGSWIHAYLHRKEGDRANAGYWYSKAGKPYPEQSLDEEWKALVRSFT